MITKEITEARKISETTRLKEHYEELEKLFNDSMSGDAITCKIEDMDEAAVSFAISLLPGSPGHKNPIQHITYKGRVTDITYWLDNKVDIYTLRRWIVCCEKLENSYAGAYLRIPSLKYCNEHPEAVLNINEIDEIDGMIEAIHGDLCEDSLLVENRVKRYIQTRKIPIQRELEKREQNSKRPAGKKEI